MFLLELSMSVSFLELETHFYFWFARIGCYLIWVLNRYMASLLSRIPQWLSGKESSGIQCRKPRFNSWVRKIRWKRDRLPTPVFLGFLCGSAGNESACTAGDLGSIHGLGGPPREGKNYPLQYSGLENSIVRIVHSSSKSWT